jgi:Flp pilus assembly CpaE family ATPase
MERPRVMIALTPVAERAVEHLVFGRDAALEVVASAPDAGELECEIVSSRAEGVLVSPDLSGLTTAHCARVRSHGVRVAGLARDSHERQQLHALGVDVIVEPADPPAAFADALRGPTEQANVEWQEPEKSSGRYSRNEDGGAVLAVIGTKGAPGASECAASLAGLTAGRWSCVLVEFDALGGALDLRLGADPRQGSVLGLSRAAAGGDGALGELLDRWLSRRAGWPPTLVGAPEPAGALEELARPGVAARTLRALASQFPLVIADVGFLLFEGDDASSACRVHREAVVTADAVLLVMGAREEQLRAGLDQLDSLLALGVPPERLRIALNGAGAPGATASTQLDSLLQAQLAERRFALDAWLPWDRRALARAQRTGLPLAGARPRGAYARALARLLDDLFLPVVPAPRQRKLRLVPPRPRDSEHTEEVALT